MFKVGKLSLIASFGLSVFGSYGYASNWLKFRALRLETSNTRELSNQLQAMSNGSESPVTKYQVVQFKNSAGSAERSILEAKGFRILRYIPDNAFLINAEQGDLKNLETLESVQAVVPYVGALKISPDFGIRNVFNGKNRVLAHITFSDEKAAKSTKLASVKILASSPSALIVELNLEDVDTVAAIEGVEYVQPYEPPKEMTADLLDETSTNNSINSGDFSDLTGYESGTKVMRFPYAWKNGFKGQNQIVGMGDTGLDTGNVSSLAKDFSSVVGGKSYGLLSDGWNDPMGHGTHVAGSVMGSGSESGGEISGGAFEASLFAQGMWSPLFKTLTVPPQISALFADAASKGVFIHTNSWGSARDLGAYDAFASQVDEFMFKNPDFLILFAAGNSGADANADGKIDAGSIGSPGTAKNVLTVGASENLVLNGGIQKKLSETKWKDKYPVSPLAEDTLSNSPNGVAAFSSRGPTKDGRIKPEVLAPGTNILSNCSSVSGASPLWGNYNSDFCWSGGTSMATPLTAGAAAVVRQYLQSKGFEKPSASLVKATLMSTADDIFPGQFGTGAGQEILTPAPNADEGYGRVNVAYATVVGKRPFYFAIVDEKNGVADGETREFEISVGAAPDIKITLVYTDAPGSPAASQALVNDIDLSVSVDDGRTFESNSRIDNKEQVVVPNVANKKIKVKVHAFRVAQGNKESKQPFSFVAHRLTPSQKIQISKR